MSFSISPCPSQSCPRFFLSHQALPLLRPFLLYKFPVSTPILLSSPRIALCGLTLLNDSPSYLPSPVACRFCTLSTAARKPLNPLLFLTSSQCSGSGPSFDLHSKCRTSSSSPITHLLSGCFPFSLTRSFTWSSEIRY